MTSRTPVTLCVFAEETFKSFIFTEGFQEKLLKQWSLRPAIARQPQFAAFTSTVFEKMSRIANSRLLAPGEHMTLEADDWCLLSGGQANFNNELMTRDADYGARPFAEPAPGVVSSNEGCSLLLFKLDDVLQLCLATPQLNYYLRKLRMQEQDGKTAWALGVVPIN